MHILTPTILAAVSVIAAVLLKSARHQAEQARRAEAIRKLDEHFRANVDAKQKQHS